MSDAVERLFRCHIVASLGRLVTSEPDAFRQTYCYAEPVCHTLWRTEPLHAQCPQLPVYIPCTVHTAEVAGRYACPQVAQPEPAARVL